MHKESAQASQCIHIGINVDSYLLVKINHELCLRGQCDLASGRMGRCNAPLGSGGFYLPCVSWFRQSRSTQSTGIWPADSASSCPLWTRSHGSTRPDSWQKTHSSSSVFQRWNEVTRRIIHQLFRFARQCGVEDAYLIHAWSVSQYPRCINMSFLTIITRASLC